MFVWLICLIVFSGFRKVILFLGGCSQCHCCCCCFFPPTKIRIKTDLKGFLFLLCRYLFQILLGGGNTYLHKFLFVLLNTSLQRVPTSNLHFGPLPVVVVQLFLHDFYTSCCSGRSRCFLLRSLVTVTEPIVQIKYIHK